MIIPMLCVTIFVILVVWFLLPRVAGLMIHMPTAISIFVCLSMVQLMAVFISMRCTLCGHFLQVALTLIFFFFQAEDGIRDKLVTGVQTCALPICRQLPAVLDLGPLHQRDRAEGDHPGDPSAITDSGSIEVRLAEVRELRPSQSGRPRDRKSVV